MDNGKKYELIVKIKELMIETDAKNREDISDARKISLNASKIMQLIYSYPKLEEIFESKVKIYEELKQDKEKYLNALAIRQKQIQEYQPFADFDIKLNYVDYSNFKYDDYKKNIERLNNELEEDAKLFGEEFTPIQPCKEDFETEKERVEVELFGGYEEFTIDLNNEKLKEIFIDAIGMKYLIAKTGIFDAISSTLFRLEELNFNDEEEYNFDDELSSFFSVYCYDDKYTSSIYQYYDYYYFKRCENRSFINSNNSNLYLYVAYSKVLNELLEQAYFIDLSEEEKQELVKQKEKEQKLNEIRQKFNRPTKKRIIEIILKYGNLSAEQIKEKLKEDYNQNIGRSTIYKHTNGEGTQRGIYEIITGKKGNKEDLANYLSDLKR